MKHFLIVYHGQHGIPVDVTEFRRPAPALEAYRAAEEKVRDDHVARVVLVAAPSLDVLKITHSSLFGLASVEDLVRDLIAG